jgi:hypothetical protein
MKSRLLLCALALLIALPTELPSRAMEKILVMGFDSPCMDDLQDRFLRESLMKEFITMGHPVVPVMALEQLLQEEGVRGLRQAGAARMKEYCTRTDAAIAVSGKIVPLPGYASAKGILDEKCSFMFELALYRRSGDTIATTSFKFAGKRDLPRLIGELSGTASRAAAALMGR